MYNPDVDDLQIGDAPTILMFENKIRVARKEHTCDMCRKVILKGAQYEVFTGIEDGDFTYHKTCLSCLYGGPYHD